MSIYKIKLDNRALILNDMLIWILCVELRVKNGWRFLIWSDVQQFILCHKNLKNKLFFSPIRIWWGDVDSYSLQSSQWDWIWCTGASTESPRENEKVVYWSNTLKVPFYICLNIRVKEKSKPKSYLTFVLNQRHTTLETVGVFAYRHSSFWKLIPVIWI